MSTRGAIGAFGLYVGLVLWCTWPLGSQLTTHLADTSVVARFDLRLITWALSWETHAFTSAPTRFLEANSFHPTPHALLYAEPAYGALPWFLPTMVVSGNPILSVNLMFLGSLVLTVWGVHLLVTRWTGLASAGFVAAGTILTSRWLMWRWGPVAPNYVVLQYYPPIIALAAATNLSPSRVGLLAILIALQGVVSPYVGAPVVATLGVLVAWRAVHTETRLDAWRLFLGLAAGTAAAALAYLPNLWLRALEPGLAGQSWWRFLRRIPLDLPAYWFVGANSPTTIAMPLMGLVVLGVAMLWLESRPRTPGEVKAWRHGCLWLGVGLALVLVTTPEVRFFGRPLPHASILARWPGFDLLRSTERLSLGGLFGLAMLGGAAFAAVAGRLRPVLRMALAVSLVGASGMRWADSNRLVPPFVLPLVGANLDPVMLQTFREAWDREARPWIAVGPWLRFPTVDASIAESGVRAVVRRGGGPLLFLEFGAESERVVDAQAMFESIGHWRPLLNGYGGFYPRGYRERMRLAQKLPHARFLGLLRRWTGVELILVRGAPDHPKMQPWKRIAHLGGGEGMRLVAQAGDDLLFRVEAGKASARTPSAGRPERHRP